MRKFQVFITCICALLLSIFYSTAQSLDSTAFSICLKPTGNYDSIKTEIKTSKLNLQKKFQESTNDSSRNAVVNEARNYVTESLVNKIFPFWYGTPWEFYGHTASPGIGAVACGYFVSTTMLHCGFNLNRFKLAQAASLNHVRAIKISGKEEKLANKSASDVKNYFIKNKKDGLYIVGLDCHIGFLLLRKGELFFVQSNYSVPTEVIILPVEQSDVFHSSVFYYTDITWNDELIKHWLNNKEIVLRKL